MKTFILLFVIIVFAQTLVSLASAEGSDSGGDSDSDGEMNFQDVRVRATQAMSSTLSTQGSGISGYGTPIGTYSSQSSRNSRRGSHGSSTGILRNRNSGTSNVEKPPSVLSTRSSAASDFEKPPSVLTTRSSAASDIENPPSVLTTRSSTASDIGNPPSALVTQSPAASGIENPAGTLVSQNSGISIEDLPGAGDIVPSSPIATLLQSKSKSRLKALFEGVMDTLKAIPPEELSEHTKTHQCKGCEKKRQRFQRQKMSHEKHMAKMAAKYNNKIHDDTQL